MIICSFLGNSIALGNTLYSRLCDALETLLETDDHMELLLIPDKYSFFNTCLKAALEIKSRYPDQVTITRVFKRNDCRSDSELDELPICMIDRVRIAGVPVMKGRCAFRLEDNNLQRCAIRMSSHIICCLYEKLLERENSLLAYAKKYPDIKIVDVSDGEIVEALAQRAPSLLNEREQFVLEKLDAGFVYREIGNMMGVSSNRAKQIQTRGGSRLRRFSYEHFTTEFLPGKQTQRPVCVLFSLNDPSPQKVKMLIAVIDVLIDRYYVDSWKLSVESCALPFVTTFTTLAWHRSSNPTRSLRDYHPHLTAVVTDKWCEEDGEKKDAILKEFRLTSTQIENIDTTPMPTGTDLRKLMEAMVEQADFFICDLSTSPIAEEIKNYFAHTKGVALLDISKNLYLENQTQIGPAELTSI